ncbi:sugar phosphate nucleotidyltransferase [Paenibacillus sp. V4I7]|uniref:sugar phosphate nucleotidyltransferase n=1 Tax=Paenibacillus sp. V4I7 TaxID=3042307 RepID=UPI0027852755|nr:sugar phosphate nucleotidyltransferase [Paenibacillus sp. V4I7]MDQ0903921.1 mannose-1-phosphate guanylyltransferase [Paenibacillus sp. V4I7]
MKLVLLSGGSGKRLWPLSNDSRSKQFLKVLRNNEGLLESMVQRVWNQIEAVGMADSTLLTTSKSQLDMIHSQLGINIPIIVEPERRDTFPAIALAAAYLYSNQGISLDEVVAVLPVDPYVEKDFFDKIKKLEILLHSSESNLALLGVTPTFASEKYGYIVPSSPLENDLFIRVSHFKEKPNEEQAKQLIAQKALWNCGVFAFKLGFVISIIKEKGLPIQYDELLLNYNELPKISFDYEVVEKAKNIVALSYDGYWKDLGTWNTLTEEMGANLIGNGIISEDSTNTHLINELNIPITVLGLPNVIVAASPDGILVSDKVASPRIKDLAINFDERPMYEEKPWGWYKILDYTKAKEGREVLTKRIGILEGNNLSYQVHQKRKEVWTIISGEGLFALNGVISPIKSGDVLQIPAGAKHGIKATTDIELIEIQTGTELIDEDIIRISLNWEDTMKYCMT